MCAIIYIVIAHVCSILTKSFNLRKWTDDSWVMSSVMILLNLFEVTGDEFEISLVKE